MNLERLKNNWEDLAGRDALWAILTDASKASGKWDVAEFMATGEAEIETVMRHLKKIGVAVAFEGVALDFGCGVGRLTQPLAERFAGCVGIDISKTMVAKAEALNRYSNCRYIASAGEKLPLYDKSIAFIYSNIVLQHVPRRFAEKYLREFFRVLAPGGVLVCGVQDSFKAPDLASRITQLRLVLRPRGRLRELMGSARGDMQMHCLPEKVIRRAVEDARIVDMQFTNTAEKSFNGRLAYLPEEPRAGFVGKQYCIVKR